jgi:restriction endonuclease S subunit
MTRTVLLGDLINIRSGKSRPKIVGDFPVYGGNGIFDSAPYPNMSEPAVIVGRVGAYCGSVYIERMPFWLSDNALGVTVKKEANLNFIYYLLKSINLNKKSVGGAQPLLTQGILNSISVTVPSIEIQERIADILGSIDEKIQLNRKTNETLEQMGQALFRHYFIDNPEAEKWDDGVLGDIITNFDSKRKPLSSRQRSEMKGVYRYFGATSVMDHIDNFLFEGIYLLLAEDGSVIKKDGTPYLQYIWGKFWLNNHAHILQAKAPFTVEYLYLLLSRANVQSLVNGAVQLKINQNAMNGFKIKIPPTVIVEGFCEKIEPMFEQRRQNEDQIQTLITLRDTLLPRLISGKLKI